MLTWFKRELYLRGANLYISTVGWPSSSFTTSLFMTWMFLSDLVLGFKDVVVGVGVTDSVPSYWTAFSSIADIFLPARRTALPSIIRSPVDDLPPKDENNSKKLTSASTPITIWTWQMRSGHGQLLKTRKSFYFSVNKLIWSLYIDMLSGSFFLILKLFKLYSVM